MGVSAITCVILAFVFVLKYLEWEWQFSEPHHLIGFIILLVMFLQPILGVLADKFYNPFRHEVKDILVLFEIFA
jgi:hypothetical protein